MPLPGAISPAETGEIWARGEARRSEVDQPIRQRLVRVGDVNVADKGRTTSRCNKAIIPASSLPPLLPHATRTSKNNTARYLTFSSVRGSERGPSG